MSSDSIPDGPDADGAPVRTITDLAKLAGVSPGTVSRALAGKSVVNAKTRATIEELASTHGFRPNQMASRLRTQRTDVVGVVIPLGHERRQMISDMFFMSLLGQITDQLTERGYDLLLSRVIPDREPDWLGRISGSGMVDGILVIGQSDQFETIEAAVGKTKPFVVWGDHRPGQLHSVVGTDNHSGGRQAIEHLAQRGCKRLAFLGRTGPPEFAARYAGACEAAEAAGVELEQHDVHLAAGEMEAEIAAVLDGNKGRYDGVFAVADRIAIGFVDAMRGRGLSAPDDIAVVGFDDIPLAAQIRPTITTVRQDLAGGAKAIVDLLMRQLQGEDGGVVIMPPKLIKRESA